MNRKHSFLTNHSISIFLDEHSSARAGVFPSIEIARKIADILDVSLDYLTGKVDVEMDKTTRKRILEVSKFEDDNKLHVFSVIYAFIAKRKIQSIM